MAETTADNTTKPEAGDLCQDETIRTARKKTFAKMKWAPIFYSASRLMGIFGGPMLGSGLLAWIGLGGAAPAVTTIAIVITAVGAALSVLSIAADYLGTRISQDGYLDQTEVGAQSTARHIAKELKANNLVVTEEKHAQNQRADGKSWVQAVNKETVAQARVQI
jgi:hypothetical protein